MQRVLGVVLAGLTLGCGSETVSATGEVAEICGQKQPVQLLDFESGRELEYVVATQIGQRRVVTIGYGDEAPYDRHVWSVGLCGESPLKLATDVDQLLIYQPYPDLVFVSDHELRE